MDIKWKLYKLWRVDMSPLCSAAAAAMVQIGKVKYSSVWEEKCHPRPQLCPAVTTHSTSHPLLMGFEFQFLEMLTGNAVAEEVREAEWGRGRGGGGGGSVGGVRVNASGSFCGWSHWWGGRSILPATVCLREEREEQKGGGVSLLLSYSLFTAAGSNTESYSGWKSSGQGRVWAECAAPRYFWRTALS